MSAPWSSVHPRAALHDPGSPARKPEWDPRRSTSRALGPPETRPDRDAVADRGVAAAPARHDRRADLSPEVAGCCRLQRDASQPNDPQDHCGRPGTGSMDVSSHSGVDDHWALRTPDGWRRDGSRYRAHGQTRHESRNRAENDLKGRRRRLPFKSEIWRRPTLPGTIVPSTIGAGGLNFCVRDGNRCDPSAMATKISCQLRAADRSNRSCGDSRTS